MDEVMDQSYRELLKTTSNNRRSFIKYDREQLPLVIASVDFHRDKIGGSRDNKFLRQFNRNWEEA